MRPQTLTEKLTQTDDGMRLYKQERAILEVTELICELMEEDGVTRTELAKRLRKSKGFVTQLLDGRANMTIRTISDVLVALGRALHFQEGPLSATVSPAPRLYAVRDVEWRSGDARWPCELQQSKSSPQLHDRLAG